MIAGERVLISVFDCMCIFLESVMTTIFRGKSIEYRIFNVRIQEFHQKIPRKLNLERSCDGSGEVAPLSLM